MKFCKNQIVIMSANAVENYGQLWDGINLVVCHCSNKYMSSTEFYAKGKPDGFHPGYDDSVFPQGLYDLKVESTGDMLPFSLYDWELEAV